MSLIIIGAKDLLIIFPTHLKVRFQQVVLRISSALGRVIQSGSRESLRKWQWPWERICHEKGGIWIWVWAEPSSEKRGHAATTPCNLQTLCLFNPWTNMSLCINSGDRVGQLDPMSGHRQSGCLSIAQKSRHHFFLDFTSHCRWLADKHVWLARSIIWAPYNSRQGSQCDRHESGRGLPQVRYAE